MVNSKYNSKNDDSLGDFSQSSKQHSPIPLVLGMKKSAASSCPFNEVQDSENNEEKGRKIVAAWDISEVFPVPCDPINSVLRCFLQRESLDLINEETIFNTNAHLAISLALMEEKQDRTSISNMES